MKSTARWTIACVCAIQCAVARADDPVKIGWQRRYTELAKDLDSLDVKAFATSLAADFVNFDERGTKQTRDPYLAGLNQLFTGAASAKNVAVVTSARQKNGVAVVAYSWRYDVLRQNYNDTTMATAYMTCIDTWKWSHGKWLTVKSITKYFRLRSHRG